MNARLVASCLLVAYWIGCSSCAATIADAAELPRGLIVQIGGTAPEAGEGRIVHHLPNAPTPLPYAENTVRHLVSEEPVAEPDVLRVLRPLGTARIKTRAGWHEVTKPWPDDIDEWTHWLHGPGSNPVAADRRVGVPRRLLWTATPRRSRSHEKSPSLTGMVSARGRLFYICDEAPVSVGGRVPDRWRLVARDAFSGALLWKKGVPDWGWQAWSPTEPMNLRWGNPRFIHRRLGAVGDRVYITLGYSAPVSVLDAETGKLIRVLEGTQNTAEIVVHDNTVILSVTAERKHAMMSSPPVKLMAVNPDTGKKLWQTESMASLGDFSARGKKATLKQGRLMIAADNDFVVAATPTEILCHDLSTGALRWRWPRHIHRYGWRKSYLSSCRRRSSPKSSGCSNQNDSCGRCVGPRQFSRNQEPRRCPPPDVVVFSLPVGGQHQDLRDSGHSLRLNLGSANRRLSTDTALALVSAGVIHRI